MEIRKMAELHVLYPEAQEGILYDSPELLLMNDIAENRIDQAMGLSGRNASSRIARRRWIRPTAALKERNRSVLSRRASFPGLRRTA